MTFLTTTRLRLEPLTDGHLVDLNRLNSDPEVMRYLTGRPETLDETRAVIERAKARWLECGYSWWALIETQTGEIIGAGVLQNLRREMNLMPDPTCPLEIGWRLRRDRWGCGLATEAARAIGDHAFNGLHAQELFAVCNPANTASANVMKRLGMQNQGIQRWYGRDTLTYRTVPDQWIANAS